MAAEQKFSIRQALIFGFNACVDNAWLFIKLFCYVIGLVLVSTICIALAGVIFGGSIATFSFYMLFVIISIWSLRAIITIGITGIYLDIVDQKKVTFDTLFARKHLILKALLASWLYSIIVWCGLILFIVPGFIFGIMYYFFLYELIDRDCGIWEAFERSAAITKGSRLKLCEYLIIDWVLSTFIPCITKPMLNLGEAYIYRKLDQREFHNILHAPIFEN